MLSKRDENSIGTGYIYALLVRIILNILCIENMTDVYAYYTKASTA
jgi:hypothetical protein